MKENEIPMTPIDPLPTDATPAERTAWIIARQLETAQADFDKLHDSMLNGTGILSDKDIDKLQQLGDLLSKLRKAHIANMVQAGRSQKDVAETNDISCSRVSQIVKEVGIPEQYLSRIIGDTVANLLLKAPAWTGTSISPCSFYDDLLDRYDHYLSEDTKLPETGYQSALHLRGMITQLRYDTDQSLTKKHRWLGYIQGVMCAHGLIDVDTERDWTRGLFRGA